MDKLTMGEREKRRKGEWENGECSLGGMCVGGVGCATV